MAFDDVAADAGDDPGKPEVVVKLTITLDEAGGFGMDGTLDNVVACLGALEYAKEQILRRDRPRGGRGPVTGPGGFRMPPGSRG